MKNIACVLLLLLLVSCSNRCVVNNIEVSELLGTFSREQSINYCKLLKSATEGDGNSIKRLSLLEFSGATGYDHGAVIVDLILYIGEDKYIKSISDINNNQKKFIESYIEVGLEYGCNPVIKNKELKDNFPKIYLFLDK